MTFSEKDRLLIFADIYRVRFMFLSFCRWLRGGSILAYFDRVRIVICAHQNRVRYMFLEFLLTVKGRGTPDKRIPEGLF